MRGYMFFDEEACPCAGSLIFGYEWPPLAPDAARQVMLAGAPVLDFQTVRGISFEE